VGLGWDEWGTRTGENQLEYGGQQPLLARSFCHHQISKMIPRLLVSHVMSSSADITTMTEKYSRKVNTSQEFVWVMLLDQKLG